MLILLELYWSFVKVGLGSPGGGMAALSLMFHELVPGLLTEDQLRDMVAVGSMLPGPIAVVTTSLAGHQIAGIPGAVAALAGFLTPPTLLMLGIAYFITRYSSAGLVGLIQRALRPGALGLVAVACYALGKGRITNIPTIAIAVATFGLFMWRKEKINPALVILGFGILGVLLWGLRS